MDYRRPCFPVIHYFLEFAQIHIQWVSDISNESVMLSNLLFLCHLPFPFAFNLSQNQGLFSWVDSSHHVAKVSELQLQHQFFQWIFRLISFRTNWFDLLEVQGILKSLLQHSNLKASIIWHSVFFSTTIWKHLFFGAHTSFMVLLSHPYMTTGKTIALTIQTFVSKVMSLIFNMLSLSKLSFQSASVF